MEPLAHASIGLMVKPFVPKAPLWALVAATQVFFDNSQLTGLGLITSGPGLIMGIILELGLISGGIASYFIARKRAIVRATG